jgi:hypothetical protein
MTQVSACAMQLNNANGTSQGTSDCSKAITGANPTGMAGQWAVVGNFSATPQASLEIDYAVTA